VSVKALAVVLAAALPFAVMSPAFAKKGDKKAQKKVADKKAADKDDDDSDDDDTKDDAKAKAKAKPADKKAADKKAADKKGGNKKAADKKSDDDDDEKSDADDKKKADADDKKKADDDDKKDASSKKKSDDDDDDSDDGDGGGGFSNGKKIKVKDTGEAPMVKQDLNGHDMGSKKKTTEFERDRFFVDKTDTEKTENKTLVQGSLTSSTFFFHESGGGNFAGLMADSGPNASTFNRYFTDLRLQTDFRHISGGRWDARVDFRARAVNSLPQVDETMPPPGNVNVGPTPHIQGSALDGGNEYDLRELYLVRNGERTDVTIGRQFIADMAAIKIDGVRIDYAQSAKFTYLGFAGLYPLRGSRSLSTDYIKLVNPVDDTPAGRFIGAGGFGAAYRTPTAYGAFGGVLQQALDGGDQSRVFGTANGYWRVNPTLDIYHFVVLDLLATNGSAQFTNLSGGVNYKPNDRLRLTASYNRVDTEALSIQAGAYLDTPHPNTAIQNEIFLSRLATNEVRGSISAGLGNLNRFEVTVAATYRNRPGFTLDPLQDATTVMGAQSLTLTAEKGYELYGSILDRHSFADTRIGIDGLETFTVGSVAFQRSNVFAVRAFVGRELESGRGEWEAEASYSTTKDIVNSTIDPGTYTPCVDVASCYGQTSGSVISIGGMLYYRINRDWFLIGQLYLSQTSLAVAQPVGSPADDPGITDLTGYFRIAYRF
jgi:hypothetical protein